jgi:hypothetical protein
VDASFMSLEQHRRGGHAFGAVLMLPMWLAVLL